MKIPKVSRRLISQISTLPSRRKRPVKPHPNFAAINTPLAVALDLRALEFDRKLPLINHLNKLIAHFETQSISSALHEFFKSQMSLIELSSRVNQLKPEQAETIMETLSSAKNENKLRQAFIIKNATDLFEQVNGGAARLLSAEELPDVFVQGFAPDYIVAVAETMRDGQKAFQLLFRDGNLARSRSGLEQINLRKNWRASKETYAPAEFQRMFFAQLITEQEELEVDRAINALFIRCSDEAATKLSNGEWLGRRTWFSLSERYSANFRNSAKDESAQGNLLRVEVSREAYLTILERFNQQIEQAQIEGIHALKQSRPDFIAKIERNTPNIAINDAAFLGEFVAKPLEN